MKTLEETIREIKSGGTWNVMDEIMFYLEQYRPIEQENKRLQESVSELTDAMASYRYSWGELYKKTYGRYPSYPF